MKAPRTPVFKAGIHRAQRYAHGAWLMPMEAGYSRGIPLRFLPVFPPKAQPAAEPPWREWEAGLAFLQMKLQALRPFLREGLPDARMFLIVLKGSTAR